MALSDCIETLHLSYFNRSISIHLFALRNITLLNSINCLNYSSLFPTTIRSIRILLFSNYPNYMLPDWSAILYSLSTLSQLNSLPVFMYDVPKIDNKNCQIIAETAVMVTDFGFCFRSKCGADAYRIETVFQDYAKFIKQLCNCILLLSFDKSPYYSIEDDGCGLTMWF